jgi:hypothetical protein
VAEAGEPGVAADFDGGEGGEGGADRVLAEPAAAAPDGKRIKYMQELFTESAKEVPALALLVVVVVIFIRFISQQSQNMRDAYSNVMKEHIDERVQTRKVIEENTKAIRENCETRGQVTEVLRELKKKL